MIYRKKSEVTDHLTQLRPRQVIVMATGDIFVYRIFLSGRARLSDMNWLRSDDAHKQGRTGETRLQTSVLLISSCYQRKINEKELPTHNTVISLLSS